jgi:Ca2+-binding RTX toxin-like protein
MGSTVVRDTMGAANWAPLTPSRWRFTPSEVILLQMGNPPPGPRRPYEYAVLREGPEFGSVQIEAEVRIDTPVRTRTRDVVVIFGYQSPTKFYYVHLSSDNRGYAHNGIYVVNNADRLRIDDQWNGTVGARPAITDAAYHPVVVRHCVPTGAIELYVDGATRPLMTATDFTFAGGRVAFGSFDNIGRMRNLAVTGSPACRGAAATVVGTDAAENIAGTPGRDVIVALGGSDTVRAGGGNDIVCGGDGDDVLLGEAGDDALYGDAGFDELVGGPGIDTVEQD